MPHINIQCYPKNLTDKELINFNNELTALVIKHLKAQQGDISIDYTEIAPENWQTVWDEYIAPNYDRLLKQPSYKM